MASKKPKSVDVNSPNFTKIKNKIDTEYATDRVSAISDEEMKAMVYEVFGDSLQPR